MGTDTIPDRTNGQTIVQSFFNLLKTVLKGDFVPRNSSGVAASGAGSLGSTTYPWQNSYVKSDGDYYIGSNKLIAPHDNNIKTLSANYTILDDDRYSHFFVTTGSSADITIILPTAADNKGRRFSFCKVDSGNKYIEIAPEGSEEIRGSNTSIYICDVNEVLEMVSDGTGWILLSDPIRTVSVHFLINYGGALSTRIESQYGDVKASITEYSDGAGYLTLGTGLFADTPHVIISSQDENTNDETFFASARALSATSINPICIYSTVTADLANNRATVFIRGLK